MSENMKPWKCNRGHILGFVRLTNHHLPQLMVLREALDMDDVNPHEVDSLGALDGRMPIKCSICEDVRLWEVSVGTLLSLFSQLSDNQVFEFSQRLLALSEKKIDLSDPVVAGRVRDVK